ncbi:L-dopachrome tautomerase-related protein [Candidatus Albibeggiatoa sp. nov. BB20]|uniref:L-dopachrome tautomerase-related protein n=1 Tax=Candidatus Albibeggiatoa sp. nov. BB20 TaxID=3162723 RepID=UPI0033657505
MKRLLVFIACLGFSLPTWAALDIQAGYIEVAAELPINPGNVAVSDKGRIFATVHQFRPAEVQLIEVTGTNTYRPFPKDEQWHRPFATDENVFNSLLGISIDRKNRLWVIDNGNGKQAQTPKLLAFDLETEKLVFRYDFPAKIGAKGTFIQDLAVDDKNEFVFLADVGGSQDPAIIAVDIKNKTGRRFTGHESLQTEDADIIVEGKVLMRPKNGKLQPARVAINPMTISADGETIYYGAMTGKTWYSVPAKLFRDNAKEAEIAQAIAKVGEKPVSDGASTDAENNHFFTDLNNNAIAKLDTKGNLTQLVQDERLIWPDALGFGGDGWLYIAVNQLNRAPFFNNGEDAGKPPYLIMKVWTNTQGVAGR